MLLKIRGLGKFLILPRKRGYLKLQKIAWLAEKEKGLVIPTPPQPPTNIEDAKILPNPPTKYRQPIRKGKMKLYTNPNPSPGNYRQV